MKEHEILDDLEEMDDSEPVMNGTWLEWWRGLIIGIIVNLFFDFLSINFDAQISNLNSIMPLDINYFPIIDSSVIFITVSFYLLFSSAFRQPFKRIILLALISSIFYCFSFIIILSITNESSLYDEFIFYLQNWHIIVSSFIKNFIFFLFTTLLFKKKSRAIGIVLILATLIIAGFM